MSGSPGRCASWPPSTCPGPAQPNRLDPEVTGMSRVQLSINVSDFDAAVAFYTRLFGTDPAKLRPGYANFAIDDPPLKLVLNSPGNGPGGTINHLGLEVSSAREVTDAEARPAAAGLSTEPEPGATSCYARQDKVWAHHPHGGAWD